MIKLEKGDTTESRLKYGEKCYPIVNGVELVRDYIKIYCQDADCCNQIKAKYVSNGGGTYKLETTGVHADKKYCCQRHANRSQGTKNKEKVEEKKKVDGYKVIPWTKKQIDNYSRFMARL